jgi:hypothetical protein
MEGEGAERAVVSVGILSCGDPRPDFLSCYKILLCARAYHFNQRRKSLRSLSETQPPPLRERLRLLKGSGPDRSVDRATFSSPHPLFIGIPLSLASSLSDEGKGAMESYICGTHAPCAASAVAQGV